MSATEAQRKNLNEWLTKLRSGEYEQTRGCLQNREGFCCLGVLGDAVSDTEAKWVGTSHDVEDEYLLEIDGKTHSADFDESYLAEWTGLGGKVLDIEYEKEREPEDPEFHTPIMSMLIEMNDEYNYSFGEIADFIEKTAKEQGLLD